MNLKDARNVHTYWKKKYELKDKEIALLKEIAYSEYPFVIKGDLYCVCNCHATLEKYKKRLIKARLIVEEKRDRRVTYHATLKGYKYLRKWEKEEDLAQK